MAETTSVTLPNKESLVAIVTQGDVSKLTEAERADYLVNLCDSLGLNPLLKPFEFIKLKDGRKVLYATKNCADQLREARKIKLDIVYQGALKLHEDTYANEIYIVEVKATMGDQSVNEVGTSWIKNITGDDLANAIMKAWTKARRRAVLAITGISVPDESEIGSIAGATPMLTEGPTRVLPSRKDTVDAEIMKPVEATRIK